MPANAGRVEADGDGAELRAAIPGAPDPPAVEPGGSVRVAVDVTLGEAARRAAVVLVEPFRPAGGRGIRRSLVPGETRQVVVEVAIPTATTPGVRRIVVRATAAGGAVAEATVPVEVLGDSQPAPAASSTAAPAPVEDRSTPTPAPAPAPAPVVDPPAPAAHRASSPRRRRRPRLPAVIVAVVVVAAVVAAVAYAVVRDDGDPSPALPAGPTAPTAPGPGATGTVAADEDEAPDLGTTFAVTGTVDLGDLDPATVLVSVGVSVDGATATVTSAVDADGRYRLELPEGIHRIVVTAPGHRETPQTVVVEQGPVEVEAITPIPA